MDGELSNADGGIDIMAEVDEPIPTVTEGDPLSTITYIDDQWQQEVVVQEWPDGTHVLIASDGNSTNTITIGQEAMRQIARSVLSVAGEWSSFDH